VAGALDRELEMTDFPLASFDPTYGYDLSRLSEVGAPVTPQDFAAFWRETYRRARTIALRLSRREIECPDANYRLEEVKYDSWEGVRIGAWLVQPKEGALQSSVVVGHGYGGRTGPDYALPFIQAAQIFPCARGFHRSAAPQLPSVAGAHVLHGIDPRETYLHRGSVVAICLAASAPTAGTAPHPPLFFYAGSVRGRLGPLAFRC